MNETSVQSGERLSIDIDALFREHFRSIHNFFVKRGFSSEESRDLAQETFFRAFRKADSYRGESKASGWLFAIAMNLWRNHLRDQSAAKRDREEVAISEKTEPLLPPSSDDDPFEQAAEAERQAQLDQAITNLPERLRQCMHLRLRQGLDYKDIAGLLGVSLGTVKSQISDGRKRLQATMADRDQSPDRSSVRGGDDARP